MGRNRKGIKAWMVLNDVTVNDIVKATGCQQPYITRTINGEKNCREALFFLEEKGCPARLLALPERRV